MGYNFNLQDYKSVLSLTTMVKLLTCSPFSSTVTMKLMFFCCKNGEISALRGDDCSLARLEMEDFGLGSSAKDVDSIRVFLQNRVRPQGIVEVVQDKPVVTDEVEAFGCLEMSSAEEVGEDSGSAEGKAGQESPSGVRSYIEIGKAEQAAADGERNQWNNWTIHGF